MSNLTIATNLPDLRKAEVSPRELSSEYWTPEKEGEFKVGVILEIIEESYTNEREETIKLPCVIMLEQNEDLTFKTIRNGSKRFVATVEAAIENGEVVPGQTPVKVTFVGKARNKTNSFSSDRWSIRRIIL